MKLNTAGLALLKTFEKCRLRAFLPTPDDVPTIGWGATGSDVRLGLVWSQQQCDDRLAHDIAWREDKLTRLLENVPTTSNEFSALICLVYNIGFGDPSHVPPIPGLITSTVLRRHKLGDKQGAADAFLMWDKQKGKVLPGLLNRRKAERNLYLEP